MPVSGSVSALVPAYRHADFVGAALDGIAGQTLRPFETVVVDDGSPDATAEVVRSHPLEGLRLLEQENRGAHAALNRAMEESQGEWLAILNSDDVWTPGWVEGALGTAAATGAGLVFGAVRWVDAQGRDLPPDDPRVQWYREARTTARESPSLETALRVHNVAVTTSNFLVHRVLWEAVGGFRDLRWVHDLDFLLRALRLVPERVRFVPSLPAVRYRVHPANTITEDVEAAQAERARMLESLDRESSVTPRGLPGLLRRVFASGSVGQVSEPGSGVGARIDGWRPRLPPPPDPAGRGFRVGIVTPSLDTGGLEEAIAMLAEGLSREGAAVVVRARTGGAVADRIRALGIDLSIGPDEALGGWMDSAAPEVLSTHFTSPAVTEAAGARGIPVVETIHNVFAWFREADWTREATKAAGLAGVIAVSRMVADDWCAHLPDFPRERVNLVPNAVHPERMAAPPRDFARDLLDLPADARVVAHLGRISIQKNQAAIATAFEEARTGIDGPAILLLVGPDGDDGTRARIEREHPEALRSGRIRLLGPHPRPAVVWAASDLFVAFSIFEGWSLAASEALWSGLPVILGECGGVPELLELAGTGGRGVPHPLGAPTGLGPPSLEDPAIGVPTRPLVDALRTALTGPLPTLPEPSRRVIRERLDATRLAREVLEVLRSAQ